MLNKKPGFKIYVNYVMPRFLKDINNECDNLFILPIFNGKIGSILVSKSFGVSYKRIDLTKISVRSLNLIEKACDLRYIFCSHLSGNPEDYSGEFQYRKGTHISDYFVKHELILSQVEQLDDKISVDSAAFGSLFFANLDFIFNSIISITRSVLDSFKKYFLKWILSKLKRTIKLLKSFFLN